MWLFLVIAATAVMVTLATSVSQAHDQVYCEGNGIYDHYIEDVTDGPPGRYLLWMSTPHEDLIVKAGDGVSALSLEKHDTHTFDYSGREIAVPDRDLYKANYTTTKVGAVLHVCFADEMGFWHPIALDGNDQPQNNNNQPQTRNLPVPRQDIEINGGSKTVSLGNYFTDQDNGNLTYTAQSSDTAKATTSVSGSTLTITPNATGVTNISVTASDGSHSASTGFTVVVYRPPTLRTNSEMSGIVDPNAETSVTAGSLTIIFPSGSRTGYFQARIDPESDDCGTEAPDNNEYLCLSVDLFDLAAMAIDEGLDQEGKMVLTLDNTQANAVQTAITANTFNLYKGDGTANSWTKIMKCPDPVGTSECYTFETTGSGGTIEVVNISGFSDFTTTIPTSEDEQTIVDPPPTPEPTKPTERPTTTTTNTETIRPRTNLRPRLDIDDDSLRYPENGTGPVATFDGSDPDDDDLSWHVDGLDSKAFELSDEGVLSFNAPPDFENPADRNGDNRYEIRVRVADDGSPSRSDSQDVRIRVTNQNELGAISGETALSTTEGNTGFLANYQVEDPEDDAITWSVGGPDAGAFQIDEEGNLFLESAFDFETPASSKGTNIHSFTVTAADDGSPQASSQLNVAVTVSNVNEAPESAEIPGLALTIGDDPASLDLDEFFTDPDGDALTYALFGLTDSTLVSATLDGNSLSVSPVGEGSLSLGLTGTDAGGLFATATVNVTVVAPPIVRSLDPDRDYDEIIRPIVTRYSDPSYALVLKPILDPAASSALEEPPSTTEDLTRKPIPAVSLRRIPASTPAPTLMAPAPAAPTPTAAPAPIRTSISRPTPSAQPTEQAPQDSQAPSSPATRQPTVVPVQKAPIAPRATATPTPQTTSTAAEDESRSRLPLWLIILLIMVGLLVMASMPLWVLNLLIVGGLVALAMVLASVPLWLIILLAIACLIVLASIGLVYGIITRGW